MSDYKGLLMIWILGEDSGDYASSRMLFTMDDLPIEKASVLMDSLFDPGFFFSSKEGLT